VWYYLKIQGRKDFMVKLLHTADIHLGAKFAMLGNKGIQQRQQLKNTFKNISAIAINEGVNIVLIAGDLFDSNSQPQGNIDLVVEQFNMLRENNIPVCLIPGNHDPLNPSSIYRKVNFEQKCPNVTVFTETEVTCKEYPELDLTVYGKPNLSNKSYSSPLKGLKRVTSTKFHIALAHGSLYIPGKVSEDDHPFKLEEINASGMDYIALGHWHRPYICSDNPPARYPGPPEWIPDQKEAGSVLVVTFSDSREAKIEAKRIGVRDYDEIEVETSEIGSPEELKKEILTGANQNLIRMVTFKGLRDAELLVEAENLKAELEGKFFFLRITDESHPKLMEIPEATSQGQLIKARFIKLMKEKIQLSEGEEKIVAENALQYGLALLDGKEVL